MHFEYSLNNALNWGNFSYHYDKAREGGFYSILHAALAALEFLPVVSQSVSLIEFGVVSLIGVVHKGDTSNLENDKISSIAKNILETSKEGDGKSSKKHSGISSDNVELSTLSEKEQTKIITAAENLADTLAGHFHRKLLDFIFSSQKHVSDARKKDVSHLSAEKIYHRNQLINESEARTEHLASRNENLKSLIKLHFKNYFAAKITKQLQYKPNNIYFIISDYRPQKWLDDILDACCESENTDERTKIIFRNFFLAKHEFRLSAKLDSYAEIIDGETYESKIYLWD